MGNKRDLINEDIKVKEQKEIILKISNKEFLEFSTHSGLGLPELEASIEVFVKTEKDFEEE